MGFPKVIAMGSSIDFDVFSSDVKNQLFPQSKVCSNKSSMLERQLDYNVAPHSLLKMGKEVGEEREAAKDTKKHKETIGPEGIEEVLNPNGLLRVRRLSLRKQKFKKSTKVYGTKITEVVVDQMGGEFSNPLVDLMGGILSKPLVANQVTHLNATSLRLKELEAQIE